MAEIVPSLERVLVRRHRPGEEEKCPLAPLVVLLLTFGGEQTNNFSDLHPLGQAKERGVASANLVLR